MVMHFSTRKILYYQKNAQAVCQDSLTFAYAFLSFRKLLLGRYGCRIGRNVERMQVYFFLK